MVLVSVIMCSYNHEKYLGESIDSVLNQTFPDLELIIADDYSTDTSPKIVASYQEKDPRVHGIFHQKNMGITQTLNDCLDQAKGKYISFLDSDDLWVKNKLERQVELLKKDDTKLLWSQGELIDARGQKTGKLITEYLNAPAQKSGDVFLDLLREQFIFRQSMIFKAEYIKNIRFDSTLRYVNDHRFMVDLAVNNQFLFMPETLALYRVHGNNITMKNQALWAKDKIKVRKYFLDRYLSKMTPKTVADINYQIGYYLSRLGKKKEAKPYFLRAFALDHSHSISALYAASALTMGDGFMGNLMVNSYHLSMKFAQNFKTDLVKTVYTFRLPTFTSGALVATPNKKKKNLHPSSP
jgi:teichuronic acid biosynthesis glycosyltransferase TuaG